MRTTKPNPALSRAAIAYAAHALSDLCLEADIAFEAALLDHGVMVPTDAVESIEVVGEHVAVCLSSGTVVRVYADGSTVVI